MAEQVQAILERMVPPLKDLRSRNIFTDLEIRQIVERRRRAEYALQRRCGAVLLSDHLKYIEDEINLERLRKLRKEKVLEEMRESRRRERHRRRSENDKDDDEEENDDEDEGRRPSSYVTSGPGDSHVISHVHFLYQRTLRKFQYPLDVLLSYANFARECKSFHMLGRIYAEGLQRHPREAGLWIEASSFEYFGYVARDHYHHNDGRREGGKRGGEEVNSKVVGSSVRNARVLMQRGLRINRTSVDLWLQYFALELHYVQKLIGRRMILEPKSSSASVVEMGEVGEVGGGDGGEGEDEDEDDEEGGEGGGGEEDGGDWETSLLLPARVILKNAISAVPHDVRFRLRFVEACRMFPNTSSLELYVMEGILRDFDKSVEGWVARISHAEGVWRDARRSGGRRRRGAGGDVVVVARFLGEVDDCHEDEDDDEEGKDGERRRPKKKARSEGSSAASSSSSAAAGGDGGSSRTDGDDPALSLLREALVAVPTPRMYLEGARFLRARIRRLNDYVDSEGIGGVGVEGGEEEDKDVHDASYLVYDGEDAEGATRRHITLLEELYDGAKAKDVSSTALLLDRVDHLLIVADDDGLRKAEALLSDAVSAAAEDVDDARPWLRWAEISDRISEEAPSSSVGDAETSTATKTPSAIAILRRALRRTPLRHRRARTSISSELMRRLMSRPSSPEIEDELGALFQGMISLSQGSECSLSYVKKMRRDDSDVDVDDDDEVGEGTEASVASTVLAYLNYTKENKSKGDVAEDVDAVRSIYTCVLYRSNYGKSCSGKTNEELAAMKSFFDVCFQYEMDNRRRKAGSTSGDASSRKIVHISTRLVGKESKKSWRMRVMKLYETAIQFFASGGIDWGKVVDGYQRDLDNFKYGH